ncbi:MAG: radical SAM protein [Clostridia bacterium]|nr:radical SAM protein [Clostridia bacterium]
MKTKHKNIPIFIPHLGCPNTCVFCNQRSISGKQSFCKESVKREIDAALATVSPDSEVEIAYFGGSFTGIDRELMRYLLDLAKDYVDSPAEGLARVSGIRMSTRPDYIDDGIMKILSEYPVVAVELGLQSMDDSVLARSKRGHTAKQAEEACKRIKAAGYSLVGQMMIGLPDSTPEKEIYTAEKICDMGADGARIYPTVTFYDTELAEMAARGEYEMLALDDAVRRSKDALKIFREHGVECLRIGLCASDNMGDPTKVMGGANHPALGELVMGELYYDRMRELLDRRADTDEMRGKTVRFVVPQGDVSKAIGQKGINKKRLTDEYSLKGVTVTESADVDEIILNL